MAHFFAPKSMALDAVLMPMDPTQPAFEPMGVIPLDHPFGGGDRIVQTPNLSGGLQDVASAFQLMDMFLFRP
jgi:hypothetical protein